MPHRFPPLTPSEFDEIVARSEVPVVIYVTRKCCRTTHIARRQFLIAAEDFKATVGIFEVDAESEKELVSRLNVNAVPILLVFHSGIERAALLGFYSADELRKKLRSIIPTGGDV